jgi:hypothetical protein
VYVLNDGGEVDLDLGNYERYLNVTLSRDNNITTGKIYKEVIEKEVSGYLCTYPIQIYASLARFLRAMDRDLDYLVLCIFYLLINPSNLAQRRIFRENRASQFVMRSSPLSPIRMLL